jgi:hypothetical protein
MLLSHVLQVLGEGPAGWADSDNESQKSQKSPGGEGGDDFSLDALFDESRDEARDEAMPPPAPTEPAKKQRRKKDSNMPVCKCGICMVTSEAPVR